MRVTSSNTPPEAGTGDGVQETLDLFNATSVSGSSSSTSTNSPVTNWRRRLQSVMSQFIWEIESGIAQNREIRVQRILSSDVGEGMGDHSNARYSQPSSSIDVPNSTDQNVGSLTASVCMHLESRPDYLDRSGDVCKPWQCKG